MRLPSLARGVVLAAGAAALAAPAAARAQLTVYTSQSAFNAATTNRGVDTFNDLALAGTPSPLTRTAGIYGYTATDIGSGTFYPAGTASDVWLSTNTNTDVISFGSFTPTVRAVGGFFFGTDINGAFLAGQTIVVTATSGAFTSTQTLTNTTTNTFLGFVSAGAFTTVTVTAVQPAQAPFNFAAVNNLTLGQAAPVAAVPEPATYALFATGLAGLGAVARRRKQTA